MATVPIVDDECETIAIGEIYYDLGALLKLFMMITLIFFSMSLLVHTVQFVRKRMYWCSVFSVGCAGICVKHSFSSRIY